MQALTATDLRRLYTTKAGEEVGVRGVSLELRAGELVALLGPNGCGKSTLLGMLATIDPPGDGRVTIAGTPITRTSSNAERRAARAQLGVVFQSHVLDPLLTVRENTLAAASFYALPDPRARVSTVLESLRIADRAGDRVGKLSGGLARRADLARALLHTPRVLLLDEPTTGLDPEARADLLDTLGELSRGTDAPALLMTTHLTEEAERADRVIIMNNGTIAARGTPDELCSALGARTLIVEHPTAVKPHDAHLRDEIRARLRDMGVPIIAQDDRRTVCALGAKDRAATEKAAPAAIIAALLEANARFRVGPPTLADVYAATVDAPADALFNEQVKSGATR